MNKINNNGAGKGDKPRNCFSKKYRDNYDLIKWNNKKNANKNTINNVTSINKCGV